MKPITILALLLIVSTPLVAYPYAQSSNSQSKQPGKLTGMIVDPFESRVPGATILIEKKRFKREIVSDEEGFFAIDLPEGKYRVTVKAVGFKTVSQRGVKVLESRVRAINFKLFPTPVSFDVGQARLTTHSTGARTTLLSCAGLGSNWRFVAPG